MRVYDGEFTIGSLLEQCRVDHRGSMPSPSGRIVEGVDLDKLSMILDRIPVDVIRERRERLNAFYEEVLVSADVVRGISFHSCLMILAHYNVINDSKSLRLEEFLRRRARLQRVDEAVRRNTVIGFFDTLYWSRQFRRRIEAKKSSRMSEVPEFTVPEIFVDDQYEDHEEDKRTSQDTEVHDGMDSPSMLSPTTRSRNNSTGSPTSRRIELPRIDTDPNRLARSPTSEWSSVSPSLAQRRPRAQTMSSYGAVEEEPDDSEGGAQHTRQNSAMSVRDVMDSLDNSAWGESLRRSFTQRRSRE